MLRSSFLNKLNSDEIEVFKAFEKNSGRLEERICRKIKDISWLDGRKDWANLNSVFEIRRIIETPRGKSDETCYYSRRT